MRNCPNCGAVIDPYVCRCPYCGTYYFDFTAFDMTADVPYYVKFRTEYGDITTLAQPELKTIEVAQDTRDVADMAGHVVARYVVSKRCDLDVTFHALTSPDGSLFTLEVKDE